MDQQNFKQDIVLLCLFCFVVEFGVVFGLFSSVTFKSEQLPQPIFFLDILRRILKGEKHLK